MKNFKHRMFITNDEYMSERPTEIMLTSEALNDLECGGKPSRLIPFKDFIVVENEEITNGAGRDPVAEVEIRHSYIDDLRSPCCEDYLNEIDSKCEELMPQAGTDIEWVVTYAIHLMVHL